MQVHGTVISVDIDIQVPKNGGGTYPGCRLSYREASSGKVQEQGFHNNAFKFNAPLKAQLTALNAGDTIIIDKEKNDQGFWQVNSISKNGGQQEPASVQTNVAGAKVQTSPKSTYETPEERAKKQVYIIRQSSISAAISFLGGKKVTQTVTDVIDVAKQFEAFVLGEEFDDGSPMAMKDDSDDIIQ